MAKPFYIKNPAQLQVFNSFFSSAIVGLTTKLTDEKLIAKMADRIAVECIRKFNSHIPENASQLGQTEKSPIVKPGTH